MEALQSVIVSGELDLNELDPNQVNMPETWILVNVGEQIKQDNSAIPEDQVMD